ncbi:helix-turn-helix domain-containing protein [Ensifer sp. ENS12]|nr:helix-turn-helix domain-containing protein [Ensifer sp. ENS12]
MSERTLRRHLEAELGQSWREYTCGQRMNRALELLRKEGRSIKETAFGSISAFSSAFSGYVGKTPSVYAKAFSRRQRSSAE